MLGDTGSSRERPQTAAEPALAADVALFVRTGIILTGEGFVEFVASIEAGHAAEAQC